MSKKEKVSRHSKKENKKVKKKTKRIGTRKKSVTILWCLWLIMTGKGMWWNLTAVDTYTVYNETVVESRVRSLSGVENFVERFAREFFTFSRETVALGERTENLTRFMSDEMFRMNSGMLAVESGSTSRVIDFFVWHTEQYDENNFEVLFSVVQMIEEYYAEDYYATEIVEVAYEVSVHKDNYQNIVINRKRFANAPNRSDYVTERLSGDLNVDAELRANATGFLELFFGLYPNATNQQLAFYVRDNALEAFYRDMEFLQLINPVFVVDDDNIIVDVAVEYLCRVTNTNLIASYRLRLEEFNESFIIIDSY